MEEPGRFTKSKKIREKARDIQRERQKIGADFEHAWNDSMQYFNVFSIKLQTGFVGTPFDFIMVSTQGAFALELKRVDKEYLPCSRIEPNQRVGLEAFQKETMGTGRSYLVVNVVNELYQHVYLIPWDEIRDQILSQSKGSIKFRGRYLIPRLKLLLEEKGKPVWKDVWDISSLAGLPRLEYRQAYADAHDRLKDLTRGGAGFTPREYQILKGEFNDLESALYNSMPIEYATLWHSARAALVRNSVEQTGGKRPYPAQRRTSNSTIRNPETWGGNKNNGQPTIEIDGEVYPLFPTARLPDSID